MANKKLSKKELAHHRQFHLRRVSWFLALLVGLLGIQLVYNFQRGLQPHVLVYASNISQADLLASTNQNRAAAGLGALALNATLNSAAQAKAQHMIDNNYWAHVAPDGTTPWQFFANAGYSYVRAGENLAYGFDDSAGVVQGWMNSESHKANVLGNYADVGFGFASGASYQGSENTVVVAMYGSPQAVAATPSPTPSVPTPAPAPAPVAAPTLAPVASELTNPEPTPASAPQKSEVTKVESAPDKSTLKPAQTAAEHRVNALQAVLGGKANWSVYASLGLIGAVTTGFAATHIGLLRRTLLRGERWLLLHPALDAGIIIALLAAVLSTTQGFIR